MSDDEKSLKAFKDAASKLSEQYPEYLIIVKEPDGLLTWKFSDSTWAIGASQRFLTFSEEQDRFRTVDFIMENEEEDEEDEE